MSDGSKNFSLGKGDIVKIGKGALIAAAGAILAYISTQVFPQLQESDNAILIATAGVGAIVVNALQKFLKDTTAKLEAPADAESDSESDD